MLYHMRFQRKKEMTGSTAMNRFRKVALTASLIFIIAALNFGHNPDDLASLEKTSKLNNYEEPTPQYSKQRTPVSGVDDAFDDDDSESRDEGGNVNENSTDAESEDERYEGEENNNSASVGEELEYEEEGYDEETEEEEEAEEQAEYYEEEEGEDEDGEEEEDETEEEEEAEEQAEYYEEEEDEDEDEDGEEDEDEDESSSTKNTAPEPEYKVEPFDAIGTSKDQLFQCDQYSEESKDRWSNRPFPKSSVKSLANCDLPDAMCKYFYPANFFDPDCGLGKKYAHLVKEMEEKRVNGTLWNHMPSVGFPSVTMNNVCLTPLGKHKKYEEDEETPQRLGEKDELENIGRRDFKDKAWCMTERLSFLHVHKAGGSSLHNAFNHMNAAKSGEVTRHKFFTARNPGTKVSERAQKERDIASRSIENASKYPEEKFEREQHVVMAVVRDPTERFISSIGQAMGASGSQGNHLAPILKKECIKETARETLTCVAKYVKEHTFWIELHFTPQIMDIAFTTLYQDAPIAGFSFKNLNDVLDYFGKGNTHMRDGGAPSYRSKDVLTQMSVDDYDEETLQIVCEIYEMDVYFQRSLGFQVPRCDPYIPHLYNFE